jgi:hypothetical protein
MVGFMFQKVDVVLANITHHNMPLKRYTVGKGCTISNIFLQQTGYSHFNKNSQVKQRAGTRHVQPSPFKRLFNY